MATPQFSANYSPNDKPYMKRYFLKPFFCQLIVAGILAVNIVILYILYFTKSKNVPSTLYSTNGFTTGRNTFSIGAPVSLSNSGDIAGAGASFYVDNSLFKVSKVSHIRLMPVSSTVFIATYRQLGRTEAIFIQTNTGSLETLKAPILISENPVDDFIQLETNKFLSLSSASGSVSLILTTIDAESQSLQTQAPVSVTSESYSNAIGIISPTSFLVAYYEPFVNGQVYSCMLKYGILGDNGDIRLSNGEKFGNGNQFVGGEPIVQTTFQKPFNLEEFSNSVIIPYHSVSKSGNNSGLCLLMKELNPKNLTATTRMSQCLKEFQPAYFADSIQLNRNTAAFLFYNSNNNYALTLVTFSILPSFKIAIRSNFIVNQGGDFNFGDDKFSFSPRPTIKKISPSRIAVVHLDPANGASSTVVTLDWERNSAIVNNIPSVVVSPSALPLDFNSPVTTDLLPLSDNRFIVATAGGRTSSSSLALGELLSPPVGVIVDSSNGVQIEGKVSSSGLEKGRYYYATTSGSLVPGDSGDSGDSETFTVTQSKDKRTIVISSLSRVGLAVETDELALHLRN